MSPNRHERTRHDHATETAEDYVEAIYEIGGDLEQCRVTDLAEYFAVSHVTVTKIVRRLQREGLVETEPYGPVTLTEEGAKLAREAKRRHDIVFRFLLALGVSERVAAVDAEGIEHHVSPETLRAMRLFTNEKVVE